MLTEADNLNHADGHAEKESTVEKYGQLLHAAKRPLPKESGDGAYLEHDHDSGLFRDLKALGFRDVETLADVIKNKGKLQDDKTYLMERTIQVCRSPMD